MSIKNFIQLKKTSCKNQLIKNKIIKTESLSLINKNIFSNFNKFIAR